MSSVEITGVGTDSGAGFAGLALGLALATAVVGFAGALAFSLFVVVTSGLEAGAAAFLAADLAPGCAFEAGAADTEAATWFFAACAVMVFLGILIMGFLILCSGELRATIALLLVRATVFFAGRGPGREGAGKAGAPFSFFKFAPGPRIVLGQ